MRKSVALLLVLPPAMLLLNAKCQIPAGTGDQDDDDHHGGDSGNPGQGGQGGHAGQHTTGGDAGHGHDKHPEGGNAGQTNNDPHEGGQGGHAGHHTTGGDGGESQPAPTEGVCPAQGNCRILSVGDGVAAGVGFMNGYRAPLAMKLRQRNKHAFEFVGSQGSGTNRHEGVMGRDVAALNTAIDGILTAHDPHIVILNIGNQDIEDNNQVTGLPERLKQLVERIRDKAPRAFIVLSSFSRSRSGPFNNRAIQLEETIGRQINGWNIPDLRWGKAIWVNKDEPYSPLNAIDQRTTTADAYHPSPMGYDRLSDPYTAAFWRLITN